MKFIRQLLLTLLLLTLQAIMLLFMVKNPLAAGYLSNWLSDNNKYYFLVGKISYLWLQPDQIRLKDV